MTRGTSIAYMEPPVADYGIFPSKVAPRGYAVGICHSCQQLRLWACFVLFDGQRNPAQQRR